MIYSRRGAETQREDKETPKNKLSKSTVSRVRQDEYFLDMARVSRTDAPYIFPNFS